jgi:hypothetical protein
MRSRTPLRWALFLALATTDRAFVDRAVADEPAPAAPLDPPVVVSGLPLPDGTWIGPHPGLVEPPTGDGARWVVAKVGTRVHRGRTVDVYRYVRADAPDVLSPYAQADFVDPSTGEVVGGVWGKDAAWPSETPAPGVCAAPR